MTAADTAQAHPERQHPHVTLAVLTVGALAYALSQTTVVPALTDIRHELHATETAVTWTLTGYLVSAAIATGILGRLGDMLGKKRVLAALLVVFAAGSLVCALADSIGVLIAGRVVMGAGGGLFPLAFGIVRDELPPDEVPLGTGIISATFAVGGGAGLVIGGLIIDHTSFHWIFWVGLAVTLVAAVATALFVPESPVRTPGRIDWGGAALLSLGLAAPLIGVSEATTWGWGSARTLGLIAAGILVLAAFVAYERRHPQPLVDMRTLAERQVLTTNLTTVLVGFGLFGSYLLVPQLTQVPRSSGFGFGAGATAAGLFLLPSTVAMMVTSPFAGSLIRRVGGKPPLLLGSIVTGAGLLLLAVAHGTRAEVYVWPALMGLGIGFAFAAMPNLIIAAVRPEQTGEATGVNTIFRNVGASLGAQISASILAGATAGAGSPSEHGFTVAFAVTAGGCLAAFACGLTIPGLRRAAGRPAPGTLALAKE